MSKYVIVTGASGFLGSRVVEALNKAKFTAVPCTRFHCDLRDPAEVKKYFHQWKPDFVVHCAALCGGIVYNNGRPGEMFADNVVLGANVLKAAASTGVRKIFLIGTPCAYSLTAPIPTQESQYGIGLHLENATGAYGMAKWTVTKMAEAFKQQVGMDHCTLVPSNIYGPGDCFGDGKSHVVAALIRKFIEAKNKPVEIMGHPGTTRDFIYVDDVVRGIVKAVKWPCEDPIVNLGSGEEVSIASLALKIRELVGSASRIEWKDNGILGHDRRALCNVKAEQRFGWKPRIKLEEGLQRTINYYRHKHAKG